MNEQNNITPDNLETIGLSKDIQSFLNSLRFEAEARKKQDSLIAEEFEADNADVRDFNFDMQDSEQQIEDIEYSNDTSTISEEDSNFSEQDLEELF